MIEFVTPKTCSYEIESDESYFLEGGNDYD